MGDLASTSPDRITPLALDVRSPAAIQSVYTQIQRDTGGKLDILYHNAGYRSLAMATEASCDESMKMFNTNVFGVIKDTRIFADLVVAAKGKMVFTGSVSGYTPHPSQSVYCSSTAALELYVRTLRIEMRPFDVQVILVNTGATKTGMSSQRVDLVEGSKYSYISRTINHAWGKLEGDTMPPEQYAKYVCQRVAKSHPPDTIWCGSGASLIWWIEWLNVHWLYSVAYAKMLGLNKKAPVISK